MAAVGTVLIVDDHAGFRAQARRMLEAAGYDVVGEAADGTTAVAATRSLTPDMVLLDVQLPDTNGFDVARALADQPAVIVLISSRAAADYGKRIEESGAQGFISKVDLSGASLDAVLRRAR